MKIDCNKMQCFALKLAEMIIELQRQQVAINSTIKKLSENSNLDDVIISLKKIEKEIDDNVVVLLKSQKAIEKIALLYKTGEFRISENIESNWYMEKQHFSTISRVSIETELHWSVN